MIYSKRPLLLMTIAYSLLFGCSDEKMQFQDSLYLESLSYFKFKYSSASPYYYDLRVLRMPSSADQRIFQIVGAINKSDSSDTADLSWKIRLTASDGSYLSTVEGNSYTDGSQVHSVDLTAVVGKTYQKLWIEITYKGESKVFESAVGSL